MGKNKKNDLIEDRTIRNPMQQLKRKQKFKQKEERVKERQFLRKEQVEKYEKDLDKY
jgi:hypothetical protein